MHHSYEDITGRISQPPLWWDENAVPRFCAFAPNAVANIYARQIALVEIACQSCGERFDVAFSQNYAYDFSRGKPVPTLAQEVADKTIHYGDPPNTGCCAAGATMNSVPIRVIEFWRREDFDCQRDSALEISLTESRSTPEEAK